MKLFLKIFGGILLALLLFTAFLPTILSTNAVQPSLISQINSGIPGRIEVKNYSLSWFGGIQVEGFRLIDPQGNLVLDIEKFETQSSLFTILLKGKIDNNTEIKSLNAHIIRLPSGKTNLEESLGSQKFINLVNPLLLSDVNLKFSQGSALITGKTIENDTKGDFIVDLLLSEEDVHAQVNVTNFPTSIIESIVSLDKPELSGAISSIFGDYINLSLRETTGDAPLYEIKANSKVSVGPKPVIWDIIAAFEVPSEVGDISTLWMGVKEFNIQCKNIPTALLDQSTGGKNHFQTSLGPWVSISMKGSGEDPQALAFTLDSDKMVIPNMVVNVNEPIQLDQNMMKRNLSGNIALDKLVFPQESPTTTLSNLNLKWAFDGRKSHFQTNFVGNMANGSEITGEVKYKSNESEIYAVLNGNKIPAHLFELASGQDFFNPLFGETIETNVNINVINMDGSVQVELNGSNGKMALKGNIEKGLLTLSEPFYVETTPNQKFAQELLKKYSPLLGELQSGSSKMNLTIQKEGFSAPIFNFDIAKVRIKNAKIDLGKLTFSNKGDLKKAMKFLNAPSSDKVTIWFTPQYFKMDKGVLDLSRTDFLLAESYPLAAWGILDFSKNNVDATVALSGKALERAFGIKGMNPNTFLQIPLRGKIDKVKVDSASATARIAALVAKQQGPEGLLIGTVLDIAQGGGSEIMPAATTNPLPWADQLKASKTATKEKTPHTKDLLKGFLK